MYKINYEIIIYELFQSTPVLNGLNHSSATAEKIRNVMEVSDFFRCTLLGAAFVFQSPFEGPVVRDLAPAQTRRPWTLAPTRAL